MKKKTVILCLTLVAVILTATVAYSSSPNQINLNPNPDFEKIKDGYGMELKDTIEKPKVLKEEAVEKAFEVYGNAFNADINKAKAKTYLLTDTKGNLDKPVWLVVFDNLQDLGYKGNKTELNVYIDAETGEAMYAYTYK